VGQLVHLIRHRDRGQLGAEHRDQLAENQAAQVTGPAHGRQVDEQPPRASASPHGTTAHLRFLPDPETSSPEPNPDPQTPDPRPSNPGTPDPRPSNPGPGPRTPQTPGPRTPQPRNPDRQTPDPDPGPSNRTLGPRIPKPRTRRRAGSRRTQSVNGWRKGRCARHDDGQHGRSLPFCFGTRDNRATDRNDCGCRFRRRRLGLWRTQGLGGHAAKLSWAKLSWRTRAGKVSWAGPYRARCVERGGRGWENGGDEAADRRRSA
jgi:hypothetical protein